MNKEKTMKLFKGLLIFASIGFLFSIFLIEENRTNAIILSLCGLTALKMGLDLDSPYSTPLLMADFSATLSTCAVILMTDSFLISLSSLILLYVFLGFWIANKQQAEVKVAILRSFTTKTAEDARIALKMIEYRKNHIWADKSGELREELKQMINKQSLDTKKEEHK